MNHIPPHPFAIKSHSNLIPSLPNLPPTFPPFLPFPDTPLLRCSVTRHSLLRHPPPVTRHPSHRHSVIPSLLFFIISFCHYRPSLFRISSAPIKFQASFSVMWLDDHHLTSLHSCGEQLLYCSSDLMTLFLVILYSWVQYPFISVFLYIRNSCTSARLQFVIDLNLYILALFSVILTVFRAPEINGHLVPQARAQHISWGCVRHHLITPVFCPPHTLQHFSSSSNLCHIVPSPSITPRRPGTLLALSFPLLASSFSAFPQVLTIPYIIMPVHPRT